MAKALVETGPGIRPEWDKDGVPSCTLDECPSYDGKRCREMGFRPQSLCEPAVGLIAKALKALQHGP